MPVLTLLDFLMLTAIAIGIWLSYNRGFVLEAIDFGKWFVAFLLLVNFLPEAERELFTLVDDPDIRFLAAIVLLIGGTLLTGVAVKYLFDQFVTWPQVRFADRVLGGLFGLVKWMAIAIFILTVMSRWSFPDQLWWKESRIIAYVKPVGDQLITYLPNETKKWLNW